MRTRRIHIINIWDYNALVRSIKIDIANFERRTEPIFDDEKSRKDLSIWQWAMLKTINRDLLRAKDFEFFTEAQKVELPEEFKLPDDKQYTLSEEIVDLQKQRERIEKAYELTLEIRRLWETGSSYGEQLTQLSELIRESAEFEYVVKVVVKAKS